jgi:hypothetical protein
VTNAELIEMLRSSANRVVNYAGDRIEALTAERDQAWKMVAEADTRLGQALGEAIQDKADNERLREALKGLMAHEPDYSDTLWQEARRALTETEPSHE